MKKNTAKKTPITQSQLARALGVTKQVVHWHIQNGDAPPLEDIAGWQALLTEVGREGTLPAKLREKIGLARARLIAAQAAKVERENRLAEKELMPVASAKYQAVQAMSLTFAELERRDRELPPALAGLSAVEIGKRMSADTEYIRKTLAEKFEVIEE